MRSTVSDKPTCTRLLSCGPKGPAVRVAQRLWAAPFILIGLVFAVGAADAKVSKEICDEARRVYEESGFEERFTYMEHWDRGPVVALSNEIPARYSLGKGRATKVIYFTDEERSSPTRFGVTIAYDTAESNDIVNIYNNRKGKSAQSPLTAYNQYHRSTLQHGRDYRRLRTELHMPAPRSDEPWEVRREFAFGGNSAGNDRRAYVFAVNGVDSNGTCIDFDPVLPMNTTRLWIKIIHPGSEPLITDVREVFVVE